MSLYCAITNKRFLETLKGGALEYIIREVALRIKNVINDLN